MGPPYLPGSPPSALWESPVSFLPSPGLPFPVPSPPFPGQTFPVPLPPFAERPFPTLSPLFPGWPFPAPLPLFPRWPFPAPLPLFPVRRLRVLSAPSPERGSRPPRAVPGLCPDRLRQSGFSIFHRPFAIPPSWFSGMKKGLDLSCQAPGGWVASFPCSYEKTALRCERAVFQ